MSVTYNINNFSHRLKHERVLAENRIDILFLLKSQLCIRMYYIFNSPIFR